MREEQTETGALSEDELDTIEAIARNEQTGRITPYEVRALVSVYRKALSTPPAETQAVTDEMVSRAVRYSKRHGWNDEFDIGVNAMRDILTAALSPSKPEGE